MLKEIEGVKHQIAVIQERLKFMQTCLDTLEIRLSELEEAWESGEMPVRNSFLNDPEWEDEGDDS